MNIPAGETQEQQAALRRVGGPRPSVEDLDGTDDGHPCLPPRKKGAVQH